MDKYWIRAFLFAGILLLVVPTAGLFCIAGLFLALLLNK